MLQLGSAVAISSVASFTLPPDAAYQEWDLEQWNSWLGKQPDDIKEAFRSQSDDLIYSDSTRIEFNDYPDASLFLEIVSPTQSYQEYCRITQVPGNDVGHGGSGIYGQRAQSYMSGGVPGMSDFTGLSPWDMISDEDFQEFIFPDFENYVEQFELHEAFGESGAVEVPESLDFFYARMMATYPDYTEPMLNPELRDPGETGVELQASQELSVVSSDVSVGVATRASPESVFLELKSEMLGALDRTEMLMQQNVLGTWVISQSAQGNPVKMDAFIYNLLRVYVSHAREGIAAVNQALRSAIGAYMGQERLEDQMVWANDLRGQFELVLEEAFGQGYAEKLSFPPPSTLNALDPFQGISPHVDVFLRELMFTEVTPEQCPSTFNNPQNSPALREAGGSFSFAEVMANRFTSGNYNLSVEAIQEGYRESMASIKEARNLISKMNEPGDIADILMCFQGDQASYTALCSKLGLDPTMLQTLANQATLHWSAIPSVGPIAWASTKIAPEYAAEKLGIGAMPEKPDGMDEQTWELHKLIARRMSDQQSKQSAKQVALFALPIFVSVMSMGLAAPLAAGATSSAAFGAAAFNAAPIVFGTGLAGYGMYEDIGNAEQQKSLAVGFNAASNLDGQLRLSSSGYANLMDRKATAAWGAALVNAGLMVATQGMMGAGSFRPDSILEAMLVGSVHGGMAGLGDTRILDGDMIHDEAALAGTPERSALQGLAMVVVIGGVSGAAGHAIGEWQQSAAEEISAGITALFESGDTPTLEVRFDAERGLHSPVLVKKDGTAVRVVGYGESELPDHINLVLENGQTVAVRKDQLGNMYEIYAREGIEGTVFQGGAGDGAEATHHEIFASFAKARESALAFTNQHDVEYSIFVDRHGNYHVVAGSQQSAPTALLGGNGILVSHSHIRGSIPLPSTPDMEVLGAWALQNQTDFSFIVSGYDQQGNPVDVQMVARLHDGKVSFSVDESSTAAVAFAEEMPRVLSDLRQVEDRINAPTTTDEELSQMAMQYAAGRVARPQNAMDLGVNPKQEELSKALAQLKAGGEPLVLQVQESIAWGKIKSRVQTIKIYLTSSGTYHVEQEGHNMWRLQDERAYQNSFEVKPGEEIPRTSYRLKRSSHVIPGAQAVVTTSAQAAATNALQEVSGPDLLNTEMFGTRGAITIPQGIYEQTHLEQAVLVIVERAGGRPMVELPEEPRTIYIGGNHVKLVLEGEGQYRYEQRPGARVSGTARAVKVSQFRYGEHIGDTHKIQLPDYNNQNVFTPGGQYFQFGESNTIVRIGADGRPSRVGNIGSAPGPVMTREVPNPNAQHLIPQSDETRCTAMSTANSIQESLMAHGAGPLPLDQLRILEQTLWLGLTSRNGINPDLTLGEYELQPHFDTSKGTMLLGFSEILQQSGINVSGESREFRLGDDIQLNQLPLPSQPTSRMLSPEQNPYLISTLNTEPGLKMAANSEYTYPYNHSMTVSDFNLATGDMVVSDQVGQKQSHTNMSYIGKYSKGGQTIDFVYFKDAAGNPLTIAEVIGKIDFGKLAQRNAELYRQLSTRPRPG